jgi:hypothetical protein
MSAMSVTAIESSSGGILAASQDATGGAGRAMVRGGRTTEMILTVYLFHTKLVITFCGHITYLLSEVAGLY